MPRRSCRRMSPAQKQTFVGRLARKRWWRLPETSRPAGYYVRYTGTHKNQERFGKDKHVGTEATKAAQVMIL